MCKNRRTGFPGPCLLTGNRCHPWVDLHADRRDVGRDRLEETAFPAGRLDHQIGYIQLREVPLDQSLRHPEGSEELAKLFRVGVHRLHPNGTDGATASTRKSTKERPF